MAFMARCGIHLRFYRCGHILGDAGSAALSETEEGNISEEATALGESPQPRCSVLVERVPPRLRSERRGAAPVFCCVVWA